MDKDLMLEVYASDNEIIPLKFMQYKIQANTIFENSIATIRNVCRKISNMNSYVGVFENGVAMSTLDKIANIPCFEGLRIVFEKEVILPVEGNEKIYAKVVEYYINQKLRTVKINDKYAKYNCRNGRDIICNYIKEQTGRFAVVENSDKSIRLSRKIKIKVNIEADRKAYLELFASSEFTARDSIAEIIEKEIDIEGIRVKNDWAYDKQSGTIDSLGDRTVTEKLSWGCSLKEYYIKLKQGYRVENIPDDTRVVNVKMHNGKVVEYYPQALKPVITREYILKHEPEFSKKIEKLVKLNTDMRIKLDQEFITDIGNLEALSKISFNSFCCPVSDLGYLKGKLDKPVFICGNGS